MSNTCGPVLVSRAQTAGTAYAFGVYSPQLKANLHFNQNEIQTVATLGNFGSPILAGIAFDRYGPMAAGGVGIVSMVRRVECCSTGVCVVDGVVCPNGDEQVLGYSLMWLGATKQIAHTPVALGVFSLLFNHGATCLDTAVVLTSVRNFPSNAGVVAGMARVSGSCVTGAVNVTSDTPPRCMRCAREYCTCSGSDGGIALY
jgi:hypothetical protein